MDGPRTVKTGPRCHSLQFEQGMKLKSHSCHTIEALSSP